METDVVEWAGVVDNLQPQEVQIYNLDRPCRFDLEEVDKDTPIGVQRLLDANGVSGEIY